MSGARQGLAGREVGGRFQGLVDLINQGYEQTGRAVITRKAVPGRFLQRRGRRLSPSAEVLALNGQIADGGELRLFVPESKAEPDYGGVLAPQGRAIFFDAKSTKRGRIDYDNLHPHQVAYLRRVAAMGALAGFLVEFSRSEEVFFVPIQLIAPETGGARRRSLGLDVLHEILEPVRPGTGLVVLDYLAALDRLEGRYGVGMSGLRLPTALRV
ncbi:MAG: hypothetical protein A2284_00015 [Deltaproteobacteria bacterium RIFOXYA12_FULL_61_11]|nr:MAG: hypothetical protein A2284_00015 [Deltaproteobacteria bacterium RIFOXYA12_FULL_61_11]